MTTMHRKGKPRKYCSVQCYHSAKAKPVSERFWPKVDASGGPDACWEWRAYRIPNGYGAIQMPDSLQMAHRVSWELAHGPIPEGMIICHHCDNPPCVNPAHLFLGTHKTNAEDRTRKNRDNPSFGNDHPFAKLTEDDVRRIRRKIANGDRLVTIAAEFGVTGGAIRKVRDGDTWKHVK